MPSVTPMRRMVALGSAAMQCTDSKILAFIPLPSTVAVTTSVSMRCGKGSTLLSAQKPERRMSQRHVRGQGGSGGDVGPGKHQVNVRCVSRRIARSACWCARVCGGVGEA
eukprot:185678-Prymnesium_polylepis.2